jgi:purine-binding chemotaxis protein CheW
MEHQQAPEDLQLLVFELAGVRYALELRAVREVVRAVLIAPLPDAPPAIEGVIAVRGELIPVYDLRARFGLAPRALDPQEMLIIAWTGTRLVAFRCERTEWVEHVPRSTVAPPPAPSPSRHIAGIARLPDGLVLIQDLDVFLDEEEAVRLDEVMSHVERQR